MSRAFRKNNKGQRGKKTSEFNQKTYQEGFGINHYQMSPAQKQCQNVIRANTLSFIQGPAGTGKSLGILHYFVQKYLENNNLEIIVIKTPVESSGKDRIGFLPDDLNSKLEPHFAATKKTLCDLLSAGKVESDIGNRIHFMCPNFILGSTLDNALILIEEAQQLEPMIMKLLLERIGKNSVCVVTGDPMQLYTYDKNRNGLTDAVNRFFTDKGVSKYPDVGLFKFKPEDVQRSDIVKIVIEAYYATTGGDNAGK